MPPITRIIAARSASAPAETIRTLHAELAAVGLPVFEVEVTGTPRFEAATEARVREFQSLYHLPETGDLDPVTGGIMSLAALVMTEGNRDTLKAKLKDAVSSGPNSPEYHYWLARYAIMAGDYEIPNVIFNLHPSVGTFANDLDGIFNPDPQPQAPDLPHPENFYSYQEDLVSRSQLDELRHQLASITRETYALDINSRYHPAPLVDPALLDPSSFDRAAHTARAALSAIAAWQEGNRHAAHREFALAVSSYEECRSWVGDYFGAGPHVSAVHRIETVLKQRRVAGAFPQFWKNLRWRRTLLALSELRGADRKAVDETPNARASAASFMWRFTFGPAIGNEFGSTSGYVPQLDSLLIVMATVWVPLAIGEVDCQRRNYIAAIQAYTDLLAAHMSVDVSYRYLCEFIEIPFIRLRMLEALLGKADSEYKAGTKAAAQPEVLLAQQTYQQVLDRVSEDGHYVDNVLQGAAALKASIQDAIATKQTASLAFRTLGKTLTVPTLSGATSVAAGLDLAVAPHQSIAQIQAPGDPRSTNPYLYAIALLAQGKLEQIKAQFNYLGYPDEYLPPWRFSFLLDQARYFAEHAKASQRDYLNFLSNAEREEFQEQSLAQNVEMEKSNIRIETAKVDLAGKEVAAAEAAKEGATLRAVHAHDAVEAYRNFMDQTEDEEIWGFIGSTFSRLSNYAKATSGGVAVVSALQATLDSIRDTQGLEARATHRENEYRKLEHAAIEAEHSAALAQKQVEIAQSKLYIDGLLRQAAIMRHEIAVQNLQYLRRRTLNAEQWFRIANGIRSVSDTYLHYAMELAFLTEQAYEFESGKVFNVIRFDYDISETGGLLAADFLLRDLDGFQQDLIVSQQTRQQQVQYILSMARELPESLRVLAETGEVFFSVPLEQLERRFPGLINLRILNVEVQPIALMDTGRLSIELTHLGTGQLRVNARPGNTPLNRTDINPNSEWLENAGTDWPVKIQAAAPETTFYSGLTSQGTASLSGITANQRAAFQGQPAASAWRIRMPLEGNGIVPNSLADVAVSFSLSGYYNEPFRSLVAKTPRKHLVTTAWISGHQSFPDSYYQFSRTGQLDWSISPAMLPSWRGFGELENIGVWCVPSFKRPQLGRIICSYPIEFEIDSDGQTSFLRALPNLSMTTANLTLTTSVLPGTSFDAIMFDYGDGTGLTTDVIHSYNRPGSYEVLIRIVADGRLTEYHAAVSVSRQHAVQSPCIALPSLQATLLGNGKVAIRPMLQIPSGESLTASWRIDGVRPDRNSTPTTFTLDLPEAGSKFRYVLHMAAIRPLKAHFFSLQRHEPQRVLLLDGLRLASNRPFGGIVTSLNEFGQHVFKDGVTLSPTDRWTLGLPLDDNPCLVSVSSADTRQHDLGELADVFLALEYKVRDE